jgi:hypothetical protein
MQTSQSGYAKRPIAGKFRMLRSGGTGRKSTCPTAGYSSKSGCSINN